MNAIKEYDPKTAFGNMNLIRTLEGNEARSKWLAESVECSNCKGAGGFTCDRDFDHECEHCEGAGRIEK